MELPSDSRKSPEQSSAGQAGNNRENTFSVDHECVYETELAENPSLAGASSVDVCTRLAMLSVFTSLKG